MNVRTRKILDLAPLRARKTRHLHLGRASGRVLQEAPSVGWGVWGLDPGAGPPSELSCGDGLVLKQKSYPGESETNHKKTRDIGSEEPVHTDSRSRPSMSSHAWCRAWMTPKPRGSEGQGSWRGRRGWRPSELLTCPQGPGLLGQPGGEGAQGRGDSLQDKLYFCVSRFSVLLVILF